MDVLLDYWPLLLLLACVGMHFLGHGHHRARTEGTRQEHRHS